MTLKKYKFCENTQYINIVFNNKIGFTFKKYRLHATFSLQSFLEIILYLLDFNKNTPQSLLTLISQLILTIPEAWRVK